MNGTPLSKTAGVATVTSAKGGRAHAVIDGGKPMHARAHIDGQVYGVWFLARGQDKELADPNAFLSVLVHDGFDEPATWESIEPFMFQYARLYPVMKDRFGIDLGCEASLKKNRNALLEVFARPIEDPRYMPVVRDLSDAKRNTVVAWLLSLS